MIMYKPHKNKRHLKQLYKPPGYNSNSNTAEKNGTLLRIDLMDAHNVLMTIEPLQESDFIFAHRIFLGVHVFPQTGFLAVGMKALPEKEHCEGSIRFVVLRNVTLCLYLSWSIFL